MNRISWERWLEEPEIRKELSFARSYVEAERKEKKNKHRELPGNVNPHDLKRTGWGIIYPQNRYQRVLQALKPLLQRRKAQAGSLFKQYQLAKDESGPSFLQKRCRLGPGTIDPKKVPYYLLLIGHPEDIPFDFQHHLSINHAVGRIAFRTVAEYERYARNVVKLETRPPVIPRRVSVLSVNNDSATKCLDKYLVKHLKENLPERTGDWEHEFIEQQEVSQVGVKSHLGGEKTSSVLVVASHGLGLPAGHEQQMDHQGAIVCWSETDRPATVHGGSIEADTDVPGLVAFLTACYGAGTPVLDNFPHEGEGVKTAAKTISTKPFIAHLPQRLLGQGALAVVGHVDRGWTLSYSWPIQNEQIDTSHTFADVLGNFLHGHRLGHAMRPLMRRYTSLAAHLTEVIEAQMEGHKVGERQFARLWTSLNDARNFVILGDPAVHAVAQEVHGRKKQNYRPLSSDDSAVPTPEKTTRYNQGPAVLRVSHEKRQTGYHRLRYELNAPDVAGEKLGHVDINLDLEEFFSEFFDSLTSLDPDHDQDMRNEIINAKGTALANEMLPEGLRKRLRDVRHLTTTLQIVSDETQVPWEVLRIRGNSEGEAFFLCEGFRLTRGLPGTRHCLDLPLQKPAIVVTKDSDLPAVDAEEQALNETFKEKNRQITSIPARFKELTDAMSSGQHDAWHFIGHGYTITDDANNWGIVLDDYRLTPELMQGKASGLGRKTPPFIFLNACHTARGGQTIANVGGWAKALLSLGAGAFLGASWATQDEAASHFSAAFYRSFLNGSDISTAITIARSETREAFQGDPTWLAYSVFAHPLATCSPEAAQSRSTIEAQVTQREVPKSLSPAAPLSLQAIEPSEAKPKNPSIVKKKPAPAHLPRDFLHRIVLVSLSLALAAIGLNYAQYYKSPKTDEPPRSKSNMADQQPSGSQTEPQPPVISEEKEKEEADHQSEDSSAPHAAMSRNDDVLPPPPPPQKSNTVEPISITNGTLGVVSFTSGSLERNFQLDSLVAGVLNGSLPHLEARAYPSGFSELKNALSGDLSLFPADGRSPGGFEYTMIFSSHIKPLVSQRPNQMERELTIDGWLVSGRTGTITSSVSNTQSAIGPSERDATILALEYCLDPLINSINDGDIVQ